jgi:DNA-directed RNA polymerase specialized sigma24 family protein
VEGQNVAETAALLGKTEGAVKVMQMRALRALRTRLYR